MKGFSRWRARGALVWGVCLTAVAVMFVVGCGGGGGGGGSFLPLSGDVTAPSGTRQAAGGYALADAQVKAYIWLDFTNPVAQGTTDSNGHYMLTLPETAVGKDIVVVATKQVGGKTVRVEAIRPDLPPEGRNNVNLDAYTTFATEDIARIREQEGLSDLSAGGVATVVERIRGELPSWNGHSAERKNQEARSPEMTATTEEHFLPVRLPAGNGWVLLAGSVYLSRRIQQGTLTGAWQNSQFDGHLLLDSTRGLDPAETRSVGLGLHLALSLPLSQRWRLGFWGENLLGHLWQGKIRRLTARMQANTVVPDADGFLHAAPLLMGRTDDLSQNLYLQGQVTIGLAHKANVGT